MKPLITQTVKVSLTNTICNQIDIDYGILKKAGLMDMRNTITKEDIEHIKNLSENSRIPIPSFTDSLYDTSSESYYPTSDWKGPSGDSWIGK